MAFSSSAFVFASAAAAFSSSAFASRAAD